MPHQSVSIWSWPGSTGSEQRVMSNADLVVEVHNAIDLWREIKFLGPGEYGIIYHGKVE